MFTASTRRRFWFSAATVLAFAAVVWLQADYAIELRRPQFFNGWVLLAGVVFLGLFNARKKLPMLPLGNARTWTRVHVFVGFATLGVFFLHAGLDLPQGPLDIGLWLVFLMVALSGIVGIHLSRALPPRMAATREPILLERIPGYRHQLAEEAAEIAQRSIAEVGSLTISSFYAETIHDFMSEPKALLGHIAGSSRPMLKILASMEPLERYVDEDGRKILAELRERVVAKNDLDFQYANLMLLRLWLFVHIPATYALAILAAVHVVAVYAFSAGMS